MAPIKNFIFDFGDVLVTDTSKAFQQRYGRRWNDKQRRAFRKICRGDDLGQYNLKQFCRELQREVVPEASLEQIEKIITDFKLLKNTWSLAHKLALRYRVAILSNNSKDGPRFIAKRLGINYKKIPFINSSKVGLRKPDAGIYKYTLKKFNWRANQTLFIDDKKRNIVPAQRLGFLTFEYQKNFEKLSNYLKKYGVIF